MRTWISSALLLLFAAALAAQTSDTAAIRGTVTDRSGAKIAGAHVTLENLQTGAQREATTNTAGEYTLGTLPVSGSYRLLVAKSGFGDAARGPFVLRAGETATILTRLDVEAASASMTVYGTTESVRNDAPELGTRLDEIALQRIPVLGRKLTSLPLLNSAVRPARGTGDLFLNNTLFVIDGGGRRQTTYTVDGSTADDAWGRQTIFTNIPFAAVRELTVLTTAFSSEYGRSTGSAIDVVTQPGGNDLRGDLIGLYRPKSLQANAPVTNVAGGDELRQWSGMISGPLVRDRTHFLIAGEYNDQSRDSKITSPLAPGIYTGVYHQTLLMGRIDHDVNSKNHLLLRANVDRFTDANPADAVGGLTLPSAGREFRRSASSLQLSATSTLNDSMFNEARAIVQRASPITQFTPLHPSTQFVRPGVSTEGESRFADLFNHQFQLAETFNWVQGAHSIRIGGDLLHSRSGGNGQEFGAPFVLGQFTFKSGIPASVPTSSLTIDDVQRYTQGFGNVSYQVNDDVWSVFVQDDWRPVPALTLNLGVRYDRQKLTGDDNNIAPRIGFAYTAGPRTVIRGGYGLYDSALQSNIAAAWFLGGPTGFFNFGVAPGQLGFPTSLVPISALPTGANLPARDVTIRPGQAAYYSQFFDVSKLRFYPGQLQNPRTQQATIGFERQLAREWFLSADVVASHTTGIPWNLDANAPAPFVRTEPGQTRSAAAADATRPILPVANGYRRILVTTNSGASKYRALQVNVRRTFQDRFGVLASYTWSHTTNNVEPDAPGGDPNDVGLRSLEWADSLLDQRHRGVLTVWRRVPFDIVVGGVATAASGRPFNLTTGTDNNGDGANTDRPVIDGSVIGRNHGRGSSIFELDAFVQKDFPLRRGVRVGIRAEGFNLTNRANIVGRNSVYGNAANGQPLPTFGQPLGGINNVDPGRAFQVAATVKF